MANDSSDNPSKKTHTATPSLLLNLKERLLTSIPVIGGAVTAMIALAIVVVIIIAIFNSQGSFLAPLERIERARGLITFLVAIVTVLIAVILTLYAITSTDEKVKDRFTLGKEVLTTLIGVLGTIVGFYFGSTSTPQPVAETMHVAAPFVSNSELAKGDSTTIVSYISGGSPPYIYSITFDPNIIAAIKNARSADGTIKQLIRIPSSIQKDSEVSFEIVAKDRNGKSVSSKKDDIPKLTISVEGGL